PALVPAEDGFEQFFPEYPRQEAEQEAREEWRRLNPSPELVATILDAVRRRKQCDDWQREGGRFVPQAHRWLKGRRWEDKPTTVNGKLVETAAEKAERLKCEADESRQQREAAKRRGDSEKLAKAARQHMEQRHETQE